MHCPQCLQDNPPGARFCNGCGMRLEAACPACDHVNPSASRFCKSCGRTLDGHAVTAAETRFASPQSYTPKHLAEKILTSKAALEGERKQVTVLFCDIAGSTALAERIGAEGMHGLLNRFFELALTEVHRYEGTINQFLGDGFMALFGAPLAHEDHARRAALAALAIQRRLRDGTPGGLPDGTAIRVRMGMNTGIVVVGKIGDNLRMDYTAVGDTTNLAARLQQLAEPGAIYLSHATYRMVERHVACDVIGERRVKGKADAVLVYRLSGPRQRVEAASKLAELGIESPLVGRDAEVSTLRRCIDRLLTGTGGMVSVTSEPGLGKSRLMAEVHRHVSAQPLRWLEGRGVSFGQTMSYGPVLEITRAAVGISENDTEEASWAKLESCLGTLFPGELADILPYAATFLGLDVRSEFADQVKYLDAQAIGRQIFRTSRRLFERLAQECPLVLLFEDCHWADNSSAALLEHLMPLTETTPLLLCWTARPDPNSPAARLADFARQKYPDRYTEIALSPLSPDESRALVQHLLDAPDPSPRLRDLILNKADGNPFFMEEVVRSLMALGAIERDDTTGAWRTAAKVDQINIPDTIQGIIMARVDRLEENSKQLLKVASVIGRSFFHRVLQAVADVEQDVDEHLDQLRACDLIRERRRLPELEYIFKHALVQEATYGSILAERRSQLHHRVAQHIEALFSERLDEFSSLLAYHYACAETWEKAQEYLFKAGDQAGHIAADAEALTHYEQALVAYARAFGDRWDPFDQAVLQRKMGEALFRRGHHQDAREYLQRALASLGACYPDSPGKIRLSLARELFRQFTHRLLARILVGDTVANNTAGAQEQARLHVLIGWIDYFAQPKNFILDVLLILNSSERSGFQLGIAQGFMGVGLFCDLARFPRLAAYYHRRAIVLAEQLAHPTAQGMAYQGLAYHEFLAGAWDRSLAYFQRASASHESVGALREWGLNTFLAGYVHLHRGEWTLTLDKAQRLIRVGRDVADSWVVGMGLLLLADLHCDSGHIAAAESAAKEAAELLSAIPSYGQLVVALSVLARCHARRGDWIQATAALSEAERLIARHGLAGEECGAYHRALAEMLLAAAGRAAPDDRPEILKKARIACKSVLKQGRSARPYLHRAMRLRGSCEWLSGRPRAARRWWQRSLATARALGAQHDLGTTYLEIAKRVRDRASLERAAAVFTSVDARVDLGIAYRLRGEMALSGEVTEPTVTAARDFTQSIDLFREMNAERELALAYAGYGRLCRKLGQVGQARAHLTSALEICERLSMLTELNNTRAELAELPVA